MPPNWESAFYLILTSVTGVSVCIIIPWLVNKGFNAMVSRMTSMENGLASLRVDIQMERESRLQHYGELTARIAEHRAVCDERHKRG